MLNVQGKILTQQDRVVQTVGLAKRAKKNVSKFMNSLKTISMLLGNVTEKEQTCFKMKMLTGFHCVGLTYKFSHCTVSAIEQSDLVSCSDKTAYEPSTTIWVFLTFL